MRLVVVCCVICLPLGRGYLTDESPQFVSLVITNSFLGDTIHQPVHTIEQCVSKCRYLSYPYAGITASWCVCFEKVGLLYQYHPKSKVRRCHDNPYQLCGTTDAYSLYRTCPSGYYGIFCDNPCPAHCGKNEGCYFNGTCLGMCASGFKNGTCSTNCTLGTYGPNCQSICHSCESKKCSPISGKCLTTCANEQYTLPFCNLHQKCLPGLFGDNC